MKHVILIKKYQEMKDEIADCIPEGSTLKDLDGNSVLVQTPDRAKKKEALRCCRNAVGNTKEVLIQPVIHYTETNRGFELTVPEMRIFLSKKRN
ncbi:MAG: hypothetical protein ABXS91_01015 [Sulfurimonas sp.]